MPTDICSTCKVEITLCPDCGGKICAPGCQDRITYNDGCTCEPKEEAPSDQAAL